MEVIETRPLPLKHKLLFKVCFALLIIMLLLTCTIAYQITHQTIPKYWAVYKDNTGLHGWSLRNLGLPIIRRDVILQQASLAAVSAYSFNAANYQSQLNQVSREFFTENGGNAYLNSLQKSGVTDAVLKKGLVVSAVIQNPPVILQQGMLVGRYSWKVQVPIMVAFQSTSQVKRQRYIVNMLIIYVNTKKLSHGIGIDQFYVSKVS